MDKVIKDIFVKHLMDKDIQSIPESDIKNLEETWFNKALKKIKHKADNFNNVFDPFTNKLDKRKTEKELNEIVEEVFSKYKETFSERFKEFLMSTGITINKVRREIIQKRSINPQKISPTECTPEELEILFRNIIKKYEKSRGGSTESKIDRIDIVELVKYYTIFFGYVGNKLPKYIKNFQSDFNIVNEDSSKNRDIKIITADNGVSFYAITYSRVTYGDSITKYVKFVYIENKTGLLRVFTPLKGNFIDLDKMKAFSSDSLDYIRETYPEQAKELFRGMDEKTRIKFYEENLLDLFKYNEKVCLDEFELACSFD